MTLPMLADFAIGAYHLLHTHALEPSDDAARVRRAIDRLVALHPMLRSTHTPPVFRIRPEASYALDEAELPSRDPAPCSELLQQPLDLSVAVFRARLYRVGGEPAYLALSIHHIAQDGPSQQIAYAHLAAILAAERTGDEAAVASVVSGLTGSDEARIAHDAAVHHVRSLGTPPLDVPATLRDLRLPFERDVRGESATGYFQRSLDEATMANLRRVAASNGLTLNAIVLGTLASLLHRLCGRQAFAIAQTYLGRRIEQLRDVGSFSSSAPMVFSFEGAPPLRSTCRHVLEETQRMMARDVIPPGPNSTVHYELTI